jgi:HNH endonuclease/AP2 domain
MACKEDITADEARRLLDYDPETGELRWKARTPDMFMDGDQSAEHVCARWNSLHAGKIAGQKMPSRAYLMVAIRPRVYRAHRLGWLIYYGRWPIGVDHINGVPTDNRLCNLREATQSENGQNLTGRSERGWRGVTWHEATAKWMSRIKIRGREEYLGLFDTAEQAHAAYLKAKKRLHTFQPVPREDNK